MDTPLLKGVYADPLAPRSSVQIAVSIVPRSTANFKASAGETGIYCSSLAVEALAGAIFVLFYLSCARASGYHLGNLSLTRYHW